jgi:hypothetical protein
LKDRDAKRIRQLRGDGQSYAEIADELGRSRSDIGPRVSDAELRIGVAGNAAGLATA